MTVFHTAGRQRITPADLPDGSSVFSSGQFVIRADGTARFDRHYHDFPELWMVAAGHGTVLVGDTEHQVGPGDIVHTAPGLEHDILNVSDELRVFWLSFDRPDGSDGAHLHRTPAHADKHLVPVRPNTEAGHRD
ncbi:cupin domain-containing protein [Kitasatospora azatica]|uniref:cupin domain-containing protein n=1 Tax=Kitasatospora azatica TaxID=58347 RepID=UPI00055D7886|nr:AraC family ligand binding domain-containing protein [Kitasatospora azatica]